MSKFREREVSRSARLGNMGQRREKGEAGKRVAG
jgi:hypothetical protein